MTRTGVLLVPVIVQLLTACSEPPRARPHPRVASPIAAALALGVMPLARDARGTPRILRASSAQLIAPAATATASARSLVGTLAPAWGVRTAALPELESAGEVAVPGGTIARLRQVIDGLPVAGGELRVLVRPTGALVVASGALIGTDTPRGAARFTDDVAGAIARAVGHTYGAPFDRTALAARGAFMAGRAGDIIVRLASARQIWHREGGALIAGWSVELYASRGTTTARDAVRTVLAADDGRVLAHRSLVADAFAYRVFADGDGHPADGPIADFSPHPTGQPDGSFPAYVAPSLVTIDGLNHPAGQIAPDSWLAASATETVGNNVDAYADLEAPDGLEGTDFRATTTAPGSFDRSYDTALGPLASTTQQMAGITALFYTINWLHDFWYDAGFVEAAGNAQLANFGRGGVEGDPIHAEAQDSALAGTRNNANMATPSDGMPPTMQVYLWSGGDDRSLTVTPGGSLPTGVAAFGPASFDVTGAVVAATDGTDVVTDACTALTSDVVGQIALVDRGGCSFKTKVLNVQVAGGIGVIVANNAVASSPPPLGDDAGITTAINIPAMSVTQAAGTALRAAIASGATTATLHRVAQPETEGSLDATVVAHEFGHYLHHRLSECGTTMCRAMSEGWGDFTALMMVARPGDDLTGAFGFAAYVTQAMSGDPAYFGIRRGPYSTQVAINALSFRHMADDAALPTTHPFDVSGPNSEVHNAGEVWAAALWEGYIALQQAGASFADVRAKMAKYVVAGLLLMPPDSSPTEARDALIAAAAASSPADADLLLAAFARRGFGSCAVSPPQASADFVGIIESTQISGNAVIGALEVAVAASESECDPDAILDDGETATLTVPVANLGNRVLTNVRVALTTATPGLTITGGEQVIPSLAVGANLAVTFQAALADAGSTALAGEVVVSVLAEGGCVDSVTIPVPLRLNVDDVHGRAATDHFDTELSVWTASQSRATWAPGRTTALDGDWRGVALGTHADSSLVSPPIVVDAALPLGLAFTHRHSFEFDGGVAYDGGVIEYTTDGGETWLDVADLANPGYAGTLSDGNPLGGRMAFTGTNPSHPSTDVVSLDLGTQLAGKTIQIRFRIGTDPGVGTVGWELDDVAFTGIVGTPFPAQIGDPKVCTVDTSDAGVDPISGDGGCCDAGPLRPGNAGFALAVIAFVLRRRPRKRSN